MEIEKQGKHKEGFLEEASSLIHRGKSLSVLEDSLPQKSWFPRIFPIDRLTGSHSSKKNKDNAASVCQINYL